MGDGHIFESDVELLCPFDEIRSDPIRYGFTLRDEFGGVELGDDRLEDFIPDRGENTLIVVLTE